MKQSHSANVAVIKNHIPPGCIDTPEAALANVDAVTTNVPSITLFANAGDCALILLYDDATNAIGVAHAGWRGATLNVIAATVNAMMLEYGTDPRNLFVGVGPTICANHYNVPKCRVDALIRIYGRDLAASFVIERNGVFHIDIRAILQYQLKTLGVGHVEVSPLCTVEAQTLLYSARTSAGRGGRFGLFAYLER
jgi:YfiH family protein